jgi:hypothetical protein
MISYDKQYLSAKASTYYWRRQIAAGRKDERSVERLEHWNAVIAEFRKKKMRSRGRLPGALGKKNPLYVAPNRPAKMPKVSKEVIQKEREAWVPPPLSWD